MPHWISIKEEMLGAERSGWKILEITRLLVTRAQDLQSGCLGSNATCALHDTGQVT